MSLIFGSGFSSNGGIFCQKCPIGHYSSEKSSFCLPCPAGWITDESRTKCAPKELHVSKISGDTFVCRCEPCPINYFQTSDRACSACAWGFYTLFSASVQCEPCPLGTMGHALGGCRACSPGTYRGNGSSNCSACEAGTYSDVAGSVQCKACLPGYFRNETMIADQCLPCPAGKE